MPYFYNKGPLKIEFRVVRAYLNNKETVQNTGIIANFSAKTVLVNGKTETELLSHNALTLTADRQGLLHVSSRFEQSEWTDKAGMKRVSKVFFFGLLPGSDDEGDRRDNYDRFVGELAKEIGDFSRKAQAVKNDRLLQPRKLPSNIEEILNTSQEEDPF